MVLAAPYKHFKSKIDIIIDELMEKAEYTAEYNGSNISPIVKLTLTIAFNF